MSSRFAVLLSLIFACAALAPAAAFEPGATPASLAPRAAPAPAGNIAPVPHRAIYTVKLARSRNGGPVSGVKGQMYFSLKDDCQAWDIQQKMKLRFYYSEGEVSDTLTDLISRESKDGKTYNFYSRRRTDQDAPEILRGEASLAASGKGFGKASYIGEDGRQIIFDSATIFPIRHTLEILRHARAGKKFFSVNVFDGADEAGYNQISTFIGAKRKLSDGGATPAPASATQLLSSGSAWPMRMAFFGPDTQQASPDYEMDMTLLENGVIKTMRVDYDDFSMSADLAKIEALPAAKCAALSEPAF